MSESYVQLPGNSTGSRMRTISGSIGGSVVEMEVVLIGDSGSYATITPAKTQQFPSALTTGGNLKVAIVEGSSGSSTVTANIGTDIGKSITGSIGLSITGSTLSSVTTTVPITGSISGGSVGITGSSTLNVAVVSGMSGSNSTARSITGSIGLSVTGSTLSTVSTPIGITGSLTSLAGGSVGITGSSTWNFAFTGSTIALGITGSVDARQSGSWNIAGGSVGISGSVNILSTGSAIVISDNTGSMLITSGSGQSLKIYDAGFTSSGGVTYFYFGNTVATTAKRFCTLSGSGVIHQTFIQPRVGAPSETVYIISTQAQTGSIDLGYVLE